MRTKTVIRWNLRQLMAEHGMFATTDLLDPLHERGIELSRQMVHRVVTKTPQRINVDLLAALCDILDCTMDELIEPIAAAVPARKKRAAGGADTGIGDLRPKRARITATES